MTEDDVPLNDPVGGWIHWQEQPELAIRSIELVRGGASDLYGSSAIGGVVNVIPVRAHVHAGRAAAPATAAKAPTTTACSRRRNAAPGACSRPAACSAPTATSRKLPRSAARSTSPATCTARTRCSLAEHDRGPAAALCARQRLQRVAPQRHALPDQRHPPRCATPPAATGKAPHDGTSLTLRLYGSDERYRQTFSSISNLPNSSDPTCSYRCGEIPTQVLATSRTTNWARRPTGASRSAPGFFSWPEPTSTTCASGTASRPTAHRRAHQSARPSARLRRLC